MIIDEPTAALDARAEYELFSSLHEVLRGRSALIISHRFSTVRTADRIYVLDHGRVVEQGTHDELVALGGQYAELFPPGFGLLGRPSHGLTLRVQPSTR